MSLYSELTVDVSVYGEETKETIKSNLKFENKVLDTFNYETSARIRLAASAADIAFNFGSVANGQLILLKSDSEFTVKINGSSNPAIKLKPQVNSQTLVKTPAFLVMLADLVTALHFGNPSSASEIFVDVGVSGQAS